MKLSNKSETRDKINEHTAQAMHVRTGFDLDACRTDAMMKQGLYKQEDSIEGLTRFLAEIYDQTNDPQNAVAPDQSEPSASPRAA